MKRKKENSNCNNKTIKYEVCQARGDIPPPYLVQKILNMGNDF